MNTYKEIEPILWKAARKYESNRHLAEDIVQAVCLEGGVFKVPMKFVYRRAVWDTIAYLRDQDGLRNKNIISPGISKAKFRARNPFSIYCELPDGFVPEISALSNSGGQERVDNKDWFNWVLKNLSRREVLIIKLRYLENFSMKEIGIVIGFTESMVSINHTKAIEKIRSRHEMFAD